MTKPIVLIVDDEPTAQEVLRDYVTISGGEPIVLSDGSDLIPTIQKRHPSLVILDLRLPVKDGWVLLKEIRSTADTAGQSVIAVTGYYSQEVARTAVSEGFTRCFPKPLNRDDFIKTLRSFTTKTTQPKEA
jgi:CheY-like chemotaxis protein